MVNKSIHKHSNNPQMQMKRKHFAYEITKDEKYWQPAFRWALGQWPCHVLCWWENKSVKCVECVFNIQISEAAIPFLDIYQKEIISLQDEYPFICIESLYKGQGVD